LSAQPWPCRSTTLRRTARPSISPWSNTPRLTAAHRIGTLFANPGGPAGQGTVQIPGWIDFFPDALKARFDIVSWDPRGVGSSTAVQCFASSQAESEFLKESADFPVTAAQEPSYAIAWAQFGQRCAERNPELLKHVSTAASARDLDRLREMVGEPKLIYIGLSYGTILGATYANLFPDRLRALVLDGNIAPSAWRATPPADPSQSISLRIGTDVWTACEDPRRVLDDVRSGRDHPLRILGWNFGGDPLEVCGVDGALAPRSDLSRTEVGNLHGDCGAALRSAAIGFPPS
jgi:pimeloyl-ACP methyl ester carboxylesterase